jgi:precorrin-2/cobalt-factor-2 C20-methyltransferase
MVISMTDSNRGTLFGVGVGPGDPKLLTIKALEVIKAAGVIFAASSPKNEYSRAFDVVKGYLPETAKERQLDFPMTRDQDAQRKAWLDNAGQVIAELNKGNDAAFLTIGDPLTYSTFGYLLKTIMNLEPRTRVEIVPGITAYHAAASRLKKPLVEGNESFMVVSGVSDPSDIAHLTSCADNIIIMKAYRNYDQIMDSLEGLPHELQCSAVSCCSLPDEQVHEEAASLKGTDMPYLTLVMAKRIQEETR